MSKLEKLWRLFIVTFSVSATTSGGHAITAVLKPIFIEQYHWLEEDELYDLVSIGQATPGSIAINVSVILGYRVAGLAGAIVSMFGTSIPPFVMMLFVSVFYKQISSSEYVSIFMKGMQASVAALLLYVTVDSFKNNKQYCDVFGYCLMVFSFVYVCFTDLSVFYLVAICIVSVFIRTFIKIRYF